MAFSVLQETITISDFAPYTPSTSLANGILSGTLPSTIETASLTRFETTDFYLDPQKEGGFVAFSREYPGAVGQGETEEEAIEDLKEAIQLLNEVLEEDKALETR